MKEIWKPIHYRNIKPNMYEVSNNGRIRNKITNKIKSQCVSEKGYLMATFMCNDNKNHVFKIHRIVATMFIPNDNEFANEVNHKDGIKYHNNCENLEWVDRVGNIRHAIDNKLILPNIGTSNGNCKTDEETIREICVILLATNGSPAGTFHIINNEYFKNGNISKTIIEDIKRKKTWKHISDDYFTKEQFLDKYYTPINSRVAKIICKMIVDYNFNIEDIQKHLVEKGLFINEETIQDIIDGKRWKFLSTKFF